MRVDCKCLKKSSGILTGSDLKRYSSWGRMVILRMAALQNQEKNLEFHLCKSEAMFFSRGGKFVS